MPVRAPGLESTLSLRQMLAKRLEEAARSPFGSLPIGPAIGTTIGDALQMGAGELGTSDPMGLMLQQAPVMGMALSLPERLALREILEMAPDARLAEADRLRTMFRKELATPLVSEGGLSPAQMGMMSKSAQARRADDAMARMELESRIDELMTPDQELQARVAKAQTKQDSAVIAQLRRRIEDWTRLGLGPNGKIRPKYQKEIDKARAELLALGASE